jgi:general secretion pathway protein N
MKRLSTTASLCLGVMLGLSADAASAATRDSPNTLDVLPSGAPSFNIGERAPPAAAPVGNPLWAVPLSTLSQTRERPIFTPSRRPPAPAVAGAPPTEPVVLPAASPERPRITLIGAVVGETDAIAIFLDPARQAFRLRTGQDYGGWVLNSVKGREAILKKEDESWVFVLPAANATASPPGADPAVTGEPAPMPSGGDYAPFVPRSTPKNGQHDGL